MTKKMLLKFRPRGSQGEIELPCSIAQDEWHLLMRFLECANKLASLRLDIAVHYSVKWNRNTGLGYETRMPAEADLLAFLHAMRPFVLQKEDTYFDRICKLLKRHLSHDDIRAAIDYELDEFSGKHFQEQLGVKADGVMLNSEDILRKWLNAFEYHHDQDKKRALEELHRMIPLEASRALFLSMMIDKANAVFEIAALIRSLDKGGEISLRARSQAESG